MGRAVLMLPSGWRPPLRSLRSRACRRIASSSYGRKWLVLGTVIGVTAGLGAVIFYEALRAATHLFLGDRRLHGSHTRGRGRWGWRRRISPDPGRYRSSHAWEPWPGRSSSSGLRPRPRGTAPTRPSPLCTTILAASDCGRWRSRSSPRRSPSARVVREDERVRPARSARASGRFSPGSWT